VAKKSKTSKRKTNWQVVALIALLVCLLSISVVSTLMVVGVVEYEPQRPVLGSMMDAEKMCNDLIKEDHPQSLSSFAVDDFSSRFDEQTGQYQMFYEVDLKRDVNKPSGVQKYYLNCFVTSLGRVTTFDMLKEQTFVPKPIRRTTGNAFGM